METKHHTRPRRSKKWMLANLDDFSKGYLIASIWAETDQSTPSGGEPIDSNYSIQDFYHKDLHYMIEDCKAFQEKNADLLKRYYELYNPKTDCSVQECAGHDFWLTRNHHGVGYWDRGLPDELGEALTEAAHAFGECNLCVEKGVIYIM